MAQNLSDKQEAFLEALFGVAEGDFKKAMKIAGYSDNSSSTLLVRSLEEEILDRTKKYLVRNGPKAAMGLISVLDDPAQVGSGVKLTAVKEVLDRIGVNKTDKLEVTPGVFILPPKEDS